jgi:hypothetical protein
MTEPERPRPITRSDVPFIVLALGSGVFVLYLGRSLTFWWDEWSFITMRPSGTDFLRPHNEHWVTLPLALYRVTLDLVGLGSYLPYLTEVVVLHLAAVCGAYVLIRRRAGWLAATALATLLLLIGSGSENLFWAFQTGFVGSVMFGVWALVVVEHSSRWRIPIATSFLLAALMCSGIGLVFLVVFAVRTALDREVGFSAFAIAVPSIAYVAWHIAFRSDAASTDGLNGPHWVLRFVVRGVGYATGEVLGLGFSPDGRFLAFALILLLAVATAWAVIKRESRALAAGSLLGLVTLYVLIGLVRVQLDSATRSRYVYVAAFLLALAVADWLPHLSERLKSAPRVRRASFAILALGFAVALVANLRAFQDVLGEFDRRADTTRAYVRFVVRGEGSRPMHDYPADVMPPIEPLLAAVARYGCPLENCSSRRPTR